MRRFRVLIGYSMLLICGHVLAQDKTGAAVSVPPLVPASAPTCPVPPKNYPPEYPRQSLMDGATGTVMLGATADACGRILSITVKKSSGHKALDDAAIKAVRDWTLSADLGLTVIEGVVYVPVDFQISTAAHGPSAPDWPKTHRHPRYMLEDDSGGYANAAEAETAIDALNPSARMVPYPIVPSRFAQLDTPTGREFWYFTYKGNKPEVAVRYQPVFDNGEPVVRLTVICDKEPNQCDAIRALFMKGLDYARAKR
jgi:TonB family protein